VLEKCISLESWAFGLSFQDNVKKNPDFHVLSLDNGRLGTAELKALTKWYATRSTERLRRPRSVYPVTILGDSQLSLSLGSITLREYICTAVGTSVARVGALTVWRVPDARLETIRADLSEKRALIT
jgi:hypothetical protein